MSKIYLIEEKNWLSENVIVGAVTDKSFAVRYCRDMRTEGTLRIKEITLNELEMPKEKLYRIECGGYLTEKETVPVAFSSFIAMPWEVFVEEEQFMNVAYASLRCLQMKKDNYHGDMLCFWCYAKSASGAKSIFKNTINNFDASVLEWDVYHPTVSNNEDLKKRFKKLYEKDGKR